MDRQSGNNYCFAPGNIVGVGQRLQPATPRALPGGDFDHCFTEASPPHLMSAKEDFQGRIYSCRHTCYCPSCHVGKGGKPWRRR